MNRLFLILLLLICVLTICSAQIPTEGLVAWYPFNGNANDKSGNGNDGIPNGTSLTTDRFDKTDRAFNFNGISDYIDIPNSSNLNSSDITVAAWFYSEGAAGDHWDNIISKGNDLAAGGEFSFYRSNETNKIGVQIFGSSGGWITYEGTTDIQLYQWYHVAFTYISDTREVKVYVNRELENSSFMSEARRVLLGNLSIGRRKTSTGLSQFLFDGKIDDIRIYNRALNANEILELCYESITPCPGTLTVDYEGKIYHTVKIGTQCWLGKNLNIGTMIDGTFDQTNNGTVEKYCYNNDTVNCNIYGGLYQWDEAMQYTTAEKARGICPPGWHIPSFAELESLSTAVGGDGNALKAIGQGSGAGVGINTSGFSALIGGKREPPGLFSDLNNMAYFFSSTEYGTTEYTMIYGNYLNMAYNENTIYLDHAYKTYGLNIRCIMDAAVIKGVVFADSNANGTQDVNEPGLAGWKIRIQGMTEDSTTSDALGNYKLVVTNNGTYTIKEDVQEGWIQTLPTGLGSYTINILMNNVYNGKNFGNTPGFKYVGGSTGNWSQGTNWEGGNPPGASNYVTIPSNVTLNVDALPNDSVQALRVGSNSLLNFSSATGKLKVAKIVQIDRDGKIQQPINSDTTELICYGIWLNRGIIDPGYSKITFAGDKPKMIAAESAENIFYNLWIKGDSTTTYGNITIKNQLILTKGIVPRDLDTVFIDTNSTGAIQDTGIIEQGTIKRKIAPLETGTYRFESPDTYLKFNGEGTNPSAVAFTTIPNRLPGYFLWDSVGGAVDTVKNTVEADNVRDFSKWVFGIPRPKIVSSPADSFLIRIDPINRSYIIKPEYGENYSARLSLRYDQQEVTSMITESELKLMRGPYYADSVQSQWNIVSLPLVPENSIVESVFTNSSSSAFAYDGTYIEKTDLKYGEGYWLKFPSAQEIVYKGDDHESVVVNVKAGWNLIGAISYPVDVSSISSFPSYIITSSFFGYAKSYDLVDSLLPMFGYWVKVSSNGQLILSRSEGSVFLKMSSEKNNLSNFNSFLVSDATGAEQRLYFGQDDNVDINRYELPPLPPEGTFDARFGSGRILEVPDKHNNREIPINITSATYPIKLHWELVHDGGIYSLKIGEKYIELKNNESINIGRPDVKTFLCFSTHSAGETPQEFQLSQNYPNPFNSSTIIKYRLPVECRVSIKIYNILGQKVNTLVDEVQKEGEHSAVNSFADLPSGVYFYRIEATSVTGPGKYFTQVKKMLLVK